MAGIYSSVIVTVNKIFTKSYGRHWYKEDIFDEIFFGGHYGDGKYRLNKNYRRNCIFRALMKFEELNNVKTISEEEAKKYIPAVVEEFEKFRNDNVKKYFGNWENMKKHYEELKEEAEKEMERRYNNIEAHFSEIKP